MSNSPFGGSVWNQGAQAARLGLPSTANPHKPEDYRFVVWLNGWSFVKHQLAKDQAEEEL